MKSLQHYSIFPGRNHRNMTYITRTAPHCQTFFFKTCSTASAVSHPPGSLCFQVPESGSKQPFQALLISMISHIPYHTCICRTLVMVEPKPHTSHTSSSSNLFWRKIDKNPLNTQITQVVPIHRLALPSSLWHEATTAAIGLTGFLAAFEHGSAREFGS